MSDTNAILKRDEVDALSSIYGKDFSLHDNYSFDVRICCDVEKWWAVTISVLLPSGYPKIEPPVFEIHTECLSEEEISKMHSELDDLWKEHAGTNILYMWIEKIRQLLLEWYEMAKLFIECTNDERERERSLTDLMRENDENEVNEYVAQTEVQEDVNVPDILSGETITLKKSTFQGHVAIVHTVEEVKQVLRKLKQNRKVSQASHNIVAYRLTGVNETSYVQDYADDGEVNAGSRLLHLMQIMNVKNIVVVVSRWYGGILLGPDRFRLISNCAREVIVASGCYTPKQEKHKHKRKN